MQKIEKQEFKPVTIWEDSGKIAEAKRSAEIAKDAVKGAVKAFDALGLPRKASDFGVLQLLTFPEQCLHQGKMAALPEFAEVGGLKIKRDKLAGLVELPGGDGRDFLRAAEQAQAALASCPGLPHEAFSITNEGNVKLDERQAEAWASRGTRLLAQSPEVAEVHAASIAVAEALQRLNEAISRDNPQQGGISNARHIMANRLETFVQVVDGKIKPYHRWARLRGNWAS